MVLRDRKINYFVELWWLVALGGVEIANCWGPEVVRSSLHQTYIFPEFTYLYILDFVRVSLWSATTLDTLTINCLLETFLQLIPHHLISRFFKRGSISIYCLNYRHSLSLSIIFWWSWGHLNLQNVISVKNWLLFVSAIFQLVPSY